MCTDGVNVDQQRMMIEMLDERVALERRWVHKLFHQAEDAGSATVARALKEAQSSLDDVRAALSEALSAVDEPREDGVTIELA